MAFKLAWPDVRLEDRQPNSAFQQCAGCPVRTIPFEGQHQSAQHEVEHHEQLCAMHAGTAAYSGRQFARKKLEQQAFTKLLPAKIPQGIVGLRDGREGLKQAPIRIVSVRMMSSQTTGVSFEMDPYCLRIMDDTVAGEIETCAKIRVGSRTKIIVPVQSTKTARER